MIESLKSAAAINATLFCYAGCRAGQGSGSSRRRAAPPARAADERGRHPLCRHPASHLRARQPQEPRRTQEMELTRLRAVNDELRRQHEQTAASRDHDMRLATEMLTTLRHIDGTIHDLVQKAVGANGVAESVDATLMSLARRLSPKGAANDHTELRS